MNKDLAERIASIVTQSNFVLDAFLSELKEKLEPEEFQQYCKKFGKIMGEAYFQVLAPLWEQYPELLPQKMGGPYKTNNEHYQNILKLVIDQTNEQSTK